LHLGRAMYVLRCKMSSSNLGRYASRLCLVIIKRGQGLAKPTTTLFLERIQTFLEFTVAVSLCLSSSPVTVFESVVSITSSEGNEVCFQRQLLFRDFGKIALPIAPYLPQTHDKLRIIISPHQRGLPGRVSIQLYHEGYLSKILSQDSPSTITTIVVGPTLTQKSPDITIAAGSYHFQGQS